MQALENMNSSTVDENNANNDPENMAVVIHESKSNNFGMIDMVEGGEFYAEIEGFIASFIQMEKDHQRNKKQLIYQITNCLLAHQINCVKGNSSLYNALFLLYAKYEMGHGCSFKNSSKYSALECLWKPKHC